MQTLSESNAEVAARLRSLGRATAWLFFLLEQKKWWQGPGSNRRHKDFQSSALPTELPRHGHVIKVAYLEGFEPPTFWSVARRSIQLSYRYAFIDDESIHYVRKRDFQIAGCAKNTEIVISHSLLLGRCDATFWGIVKHEVSRQSSALALHEGILLALVRRAQQAL